MYCLFIYSYMLYGGVFLVIILWKYLIVMTIVNLFLSLKIWPQATVKKRLTLKNGGRFIILLYSCKLALFAEYKSIFKRAKNIVE